MLTPKKYFKSTATSLPEINNENIINKNQRNDNDILVYENGTVLGAIIIPNSMNNLNNINSQNLAKENSTIRSDLIRNSCNNLNDSNLTNQLINQNINNINDNNCTIQVNKHDTSCNSSIEIINVVDDSSCEMNLDTISNSNNNNNIIKNNNNNNDINTNNNNINNSININDNNLVDSRIMDMNDIEGNDLNQTNHGIDLLNSSTCSRESNKTKRARRKSIKKSYNDLYAFPPQYTTIYVDNGLGYNQTAHLIPNAVIDGYHPQIQQEYERQNGVQRPTTESVSCFQKMFSRRPSLPFIIGILALGGVACTLGGIVLGSTGLIEHSTQYLSAALLMIGIGVSLLVISGAIWRLSIPDEVDNCSCFRHIETCRNCNSPYCNNRLLTSNFIYPEFQHRPPPPSYLTSINECTVGLLLHHDIQNLQRNDTLRMTTPPPAYRSTNSLSVLVPLHNHQINTPDSLNTNNVEIVTDTSANEILTSTVNDPLTVNYTQENVENPDS